jgi:hypothetical protein
MVSPSPNVCRAVSLIWGITQRSVGLADRRSQPGHHPFMADRLLALTQSTLGAASREGRFFFLAIAAGLEPATPPFGYLWLAKLSEVETRC